MITVKGTVRGDKVEDREDVRLREKMYVLREKMYVLREKMYV